MAPPSPITCRPSAAARHPLLLRVPAPCVRGAALALPRREALVATTRAHVRGIEAAAPLSSARVWVSRSRREEAARCAAAGQVAGSTAGVGRSAGMEVALAFAAVVAMGTGNRVLYKLALVPLREYPFFLAQFATFGYVVIYFSILYLRYQAGIINDEMLSLPQKPFIAVGLLEAFAAAAGMAAGGNFPSRIQLLLVVKKIVAVTFRFTVSYLQVYFCTDAYEFVIFVFCFVGVAVLSGASIPILSQTYLVWQLLLSAIFLKRRYRINEITGCFLVAIGVIVTVASGAGTGASFKSTGIIWPLLMIISFFLQAADTVLKEIIFIDASKKLKCGSVDLFVVNSYGSTYQLWGVPFHLLPTYIKDGAACFLNMGSISVPLSIYAFTLPLPYIGVASSLPSGFVAGAAVLTAGLLLYSLPQAQHSESSFHNRND
ncbi:Protein CLT1, chloroplastic [Dichanthelium oligosanthes]|uniref:Protein CLT1, chloroplastic n=1 Tax=Dichanthelium oligosanthes TaxID=888268 RepID=A0A1E5WA11_9POAL|nr:Protein CLT1, chloroplastic [Dichanthelium oligosanthes]